MTTLRTGLCVFLATLALVGCRSGTSSGAAQGAVDAVGNVGQGAADSLETFFAQSVQPNLEQCRSCHVAGGIADQPGNDRFLLGLTNDYNDVHNAWQALEKGVASNALLTMPSGELTHSGGIWWLPASQAYQAMRTLLSCWEDPGNCSFTSGGEIAEQLPLLGSKHARHRWAEFCATAPRDEKLPVDPRTLIQPGLPAVSGDRAVFFNGWWEDCHATASIAQWEHEQPKTCGEYLDQRDRGESFLKDELAATGANLDDFRNSWQKWGLAERPDNFDQLYTLRYGLNYSPFSNPYPLEGQESLPRDQWSGRLPLGLRMLADGSLGTSACYTCHGGQLGDPLSEDKDPVLIGFENLGLGNNNYDVVMTAHDGAMFGEVPVAGGAIPPIDPNALFNVGIKQRGQNNAVGAFEVLVTVLDLDSLGLNPNPLKNMTGEDGALDASHPLAHTQDTPPWWNMGSRPRKFFDAGVSNDSTRIIMAAGPGEFDMLFTADGKPYRDRIEQYDQDLEAFFLSLRSPDYPWGFCTGANGEPASGDAEGCINRDLAEQGAILFHSKDLWAEEGNAGKPRPLGGNGSCASCHGAYSPRYVNDTAFLQNKELEGIAAHISPLEVIGTDRARSDMLTPTLRRGWDTTYWAYQEADPNYVPPEEKPGGYLEESADDMLDPSLRLKGACGWEKEIIGYQAPPLYGVWATAPYLHNGSVPTLEQLLDSSQRSTIWQRQIQSLGPNGEVKGFDQRLSAYDFDNVGWKNTALQCSEIPGTQELNCSPTGDEGPSMVELMQNYLNGSLSWAGLITIQDPAEGSIDKRLVYDTRILGNSNAGHDFSDVLTEQERRAIIEYLKTL